MMLHDEIIRMAFLRCILLCLIGAKDLKAKVCQQEGSTAGIELECTRATGLSLNAEGLYRYST
jgi:ubiquitin C-terminal hydrolase